MKVKLNMVHYWADNFKIHLFFGIDFLSVPRNMHLDSSILNSTRENGGILQICNKNEPAANLQLYSLHMIVDLLNDVKRDAVDVKNFVRYDKFKHEICLDLEKMYPVYTRVRKLDRMHTAFATLSERNYPDLDSRYMIRLIDTGLERLSRLPGGMSFAYQWHQQHKHCGYHLPAGVNFSMRAENQKTLSYFREMNSRLIARSWRRNRR